MRKMNVFSLIATATVFVAATVHAEDKKTLTVYTYESFVSKWGPGPK